MTTEKNAATVTTSPSLKAGKGTNGKAPKEAKGSAKAPAKARKPKGRIESADKRGPGIVALIDSMLLKASKTKPVSLKTILAAIKKRFPERGEPKEKTVYERCCNHARQTLKVTRVPGKGYYAVPLKRTKTKER